MAGSLDFLSGGGLFGGQMPQPPPQQQLFPQSQGDLGTAFQNFGQGRGPLLGRLADAITGATTGQRTDPVGMYQQMAGMTYKALLDAGVPEPQARLGATNPNVQKAITAKMFPTYSAQNIGNTTGSFNPATGQFTPQYVAPEFKTVAPGDQGISYQPPLAGAAPGPMGVPRPAPVQAAPLAPPPGVPGQASPTPGSPQVGGTQTIVPGMSLQEKQAQTAAGTVEGQTRAGLLPLQTQTEQALQLVDQLTNHPGQKFALGLFSKAPVLPGSQQANFLALLDQAKSGVFRQAAHDLRGLGSLSNTEGSKLESSVARLERSQTPEAFNAALKEYKTYLQKGWANAQLIAQGKMQPYTDSIPAPGTSAPPAPAPATAAPPQGRTPNADAIQALKADPKRALEFDAYYGRGSANKVLRGG